MGSWMGREGLVPQAIISSDAVRARETADRVARECGFEGDVVTTRQFYLAGPVEYLQLLSELPDEIDSAMVVGHNPGLEELVRHLSGAHEVMPTAALALIALELEHWATLDGSARGRLVGLWRPKELPD
jgi:phosphohistidine phosphatase